MPTIFILFGFYSSGIWTLDEDLSFDGFFEKKSDSLFRLL